MRQNSFHLRHPRRIVSVRRPRGFALVVSLMLMVLLTLLAVGLLGISSIEVRKGGRESARNLARANARLAVALAIGQLQKTAGPDQRVTARADIGDYSDNRRWMGVWKTTRTQGSGAEIPRVRWDTASSVIVDSRTASQSDTGFMEWLVSGDGVTPDSPGADLATVVGEGSVADGNDHVKAPLVMVGDSGNQGAYAYWVSDESMKASVNPSARLASDSRPTFQPDRFGIGVLDKLESLDGASREDLAKVTDFRQSSLAGGASPSDWTGYFHTVGARANGVLSDPMLGGLKSDLSVYFEKGNVAQKSSLQTAVTDLTPLLSGSNRRAQGPKFGALRAYANLSGQINDRGEISPTSAGITTRYGHDNKFTTAPRFGQFTSQPIHPVLAQAEIYTRFCYLRGRLTFHIYPRIVLWNPYNVKLAAQSYTVDFNQFLSDDVMIKTAGGLNVMRGDYTTKTAVDNRLSFTLEATAMDPGEALVFSAKPGGGAIAGRATPLVLRSASGSNTLSASVSPSQLTNFYLTWSTAFPTTGETAITESSLPAYADHNHNENGCYYYVDMMDWNNASTDNGLKVSLLLGAASSYSGRLRLPLLQYVDTDHWKRANNGGFNNGRWKTTGTEMLYNYETSADMAPYARTSYGFRYKWWQELPNNRSGDGAAAFWDAAVTSDYNLRAVACHRSPYDFATSNGEYAHWYNWGPYAVNRVEGPVFTSSDLAAHSSENGHRANPFFIGGNTSQSHVYPLYDIPRKEERIVSLGRFQHAQLTPFLWHASYPVGNSWVPPYLNTREKSADTSASETSAWSSQMPFMPAWMKQTDRGRDQVMYDLSYEANHDLWDRYFLSGATSQEKGAYADDAAAHPLANARLVPAVPRPDADVLGDYFDAASQLFVGGAFNVNCTEPGAWRALLASMRDAAMSGGSPDASYSRFIEPVGGSSDPDDIYDPEVWSGFRGLTDSRISLLAERIVEQVKLRGPFLSMGDFVNRRLVTARSPLGDQGLMGALQKAIEDSGINDTFRGGDLTMIKTGFGSSKYDVGNMATDWAPATHLRESKGAGLPTYLQQGDLLQALGSFLVVRGDTFVVRGYGEARAADGKTVEARAWCEAEVQRLPEYVVGSDPASQPAYSSTGMANSGLSDASVRFGRRFAVVSFRWLSPTEV